jgi:hypothetical protein
LDGTFPETIRGLRAALKLSLARTWHSPIDSGTEQTYLGPELELSVKHVAVDLGVRRALLVGTRRPHAVGLYSRCP